MEEGVQGALQAGEMLVEGEDAPGDLRSWHFGAIFRCQPCPAGAQAHDSGEPGAPSRQTAAHCPAEVTGWHPGRLQKGLVHSSEPGGDGGRPRAFSKGITEPSALCGEQPASPLKPILRRRSQS